MSSEGLDIDGEPSMKRQKGIVVAVAPSEDEKEDEMEEEEEEAVQSHTVYDDLDDEHTIDPAIEEELMQSTSMIEVPLSSSLAIKVSPSSLSPDLQVIPSSSSSSAIVSQHHSSVIDIY